MLSALVKAFVQLPDPRLRRVLKLGILGALAAYLALVAVVAWATTGTALLSEAWADTTADVAGILAALVLPLLFFPALATTVMGPLLEKVADAVEERHYPQLNWPRPQKWTEVVGTTLRFLAVTVIVNLLALPIYGVLLITGFTVVLVYLVNGYLLGREYFEIVAYRRMEPKAARLLFRNRLGRLWLAGAVITFLFSVPILNLAAPVIATAFMTHVFQGLRPPAPPV
ncbi:MAG: EI24 domain-containing protein [Pseudomonadota bacterium]